jgi:hypothetical protein
LGKRSSSFLDIESESRSQATDAGVRRIECINSARLREEV